MIRLSVNQLQRNVEEGLKYKDDKELIRHQMSVVKYKHTYVKSY